MLDRFQGENRERLLTAALRQQSTLQCNEEVIAALVSVVQPQSYEPGNALIYEGAADNHLAFILSGLVEVRIKDRRITTRQAGQHVGEMSVIDPAARRSASIIALKPTVVAWVEEADFAAIADKHPDLWRALAVELADRLRQRADLVVARNEIPHLFIGSSSEGESVARAIDAEFANDPIRAQLWSKGVFGAS
jgi:CRP-like cAMP-binding protein